MSIEVSGSHKGNVEKQCYEGTCETELPPSLNTCKDNASLQDVIPCFIIPDKVLK